MTFRYICGIEVFEYQSAPRTLFPNHNRTSRLNKSILCIKLLFFSFNYVDIRLSLLIISDQYPDSRMGGKMRSWKFQRKITGLTSRTNKLWSISSHFILSHIQFHNAILSHINIFDPFQLQYKL